MSTTMLVRRLLPMALIALAPLPGCSGEAPARPIGQQARPRAGDPELVHTWSMPETVRLAQGHLGSIPPELADALMKDSQMPSISHRITHTCAEQGALEGFATVALRVSLDDGGTIRGLDADPSGPAGSCLSEQFRKEIGKLKGLPAGDALLKLHFRAR